MDVMQKMVKCKVPPGSIAFLWLGQAGFILKTSEDSIITIDPYLSDCCERLFGFKRLSPAVVLPEDLKSDLLLLTHEHADHFDIDSLPVLAGNTRMKIIGSPTAAEKCKEMHIIPEKILALSRGEEVSVGNIRIKGIFADHGDLAPDSIGFLLEVEGMKVYFAGDTAFRQKKIALSLGCNPDIAVLPINGMYGNLHSGQAVKLAKKIGAKKIVPCHFWTFMEHNGRHGDPLSFDRIIKKKYKAGSPVFLTPGEVQILQKEV